MTTLTPAPIDEAAIITEAQKAAFFYDDINDACPYPWGSLAAVVFKNAFQAARQIQNYGNTPA